MSDISDADKIRNKRLAKLQGQSAASSSERGAPPEADATTAGAEPAPVAEFEKSTEAKDKDVASPTTSTPLAASAASSSSENPFAQLGVKPVNGASKIRITRAPASADGLKREEESLSGKRARDESPSTRPGLDVSSPVEALEILEDKTLSSIFRITLDAEVRYDGHGQELHYVPGTRADLEEQGGRVRLKLSALDQAIVEAASAIKGGKALDYLLGCWKRVARSIRGLRSTSRDDPKNRILQEAKRICMSYCIFAITLPEMFGIEPYQSNPLTPCLLVDPEDDRGICHDFLVEVVRRFGEDESIRDALLDAVEELSRQLATKTMNDNYKPYVLALKNIVQYTPLVDALTQRPSFLPEAIPAQSIEHRTFLGPFFHISPLQTDVTATYFSSPKTKDKGQIITAQKALQMTLQAHQTDLLDIVNHIIRASKASRDRTLDWFALTVNANHKRRALRVDEALVSSDGFMVNVTICLDQLCDPFMDATFSKIHRIDVDYLRRKPRVDIREETKVNADQQASDQFYSTTAAGESNFISELFFLTLAAHHYGTEATLNKLEQLSKDLKYLEKQVATFEADRPRWSNLPQAPWFESRLKKYRDMIDKALSYKHAVEGVLLDDIAQARAMQFMRYVVVWTLRLVSPNHNYPAQPPRLPLPQEQPDVFKYLPEHYLEDVVDSFKFIFRNLPHVMTSTQSDELVTFCITFLRSSEYIKNPYLKSGLVSVLFYGIWPTHTRQKGVLGDVLVSYPFATEHLLHGLIKFYIEAETTGGHAQFFDKFNIRYEIFQVIKCIWSNSIYRERLSQEAKRNLEFFVRFVNLLLNDVTFVLDESLNLFGKMHQLQLELEDGALAAEARAEKEEHLATIEGQAKGFMQLTNETVSMLKLFTDALADSFTMPEIVQRLADMLDYNVEAMVGDKSSNLKVRQPEQYGFRPRVLLSELVDVYLNLSGKTAFVEAVARDGRSYRPGIFEKAHAILSRWGLKSPEELEAWAKLAERIRRAKEADDQAEDDLGEIPDEYLDPLMYTLMEDPVILPASKISIDRSTIRSHLLSDPHDPFNRVALTINDVRPDTDLKAKIEAFKAERMALRRSQPQQSQPSAQQEEKEEEAMDTSAG